MNVETKVTEYTDVITPDMNEKSHGKINIGLKKIREFKSFEEEKDALADKPIGSYTITKSSDEYHIYYKLFDSQQFGVHTISEKEFSEMSLILSQINVLKDFQKVESSALKIMNKFKATIGDDFFLCVDEKNATLNCYSRYEGEIRVRPIKSFPKIVCTNLIASINEFLEDQRIDTVIVKPL